MGFGSGGFGGGGGGGAEVPDPLLLGNGTEMDPTFAFSSDPDTGIYRLAANNLGIAAGGSTPLCIGNAGPRAGSGGQFGWEATASPTSGFNDTILQRGAAAQVDVNATAGGAGDGDLRCAAVKAGSGGEVALEDTAAAAQLRVGTAALGFYGAAPAAKPTITGSRGANVALADLLAELDTLGLITDSTVV